MRAPTNKPKLLIKLLHQQNQLYIIESDVITLGRSEECNVILPNSSISRVHATIEKRGETFYIKDNSSQNGFRINGKESSESPLKSGDEVHLGVFSVVFLGDKLQDNYYRGRSVSYLPQYDPASFKATEEATFVMSSREKNLLARKASLLYHGCITTEDGRFFYPEDNGLTFGKNAIISINHWWVFGVVAHIHWNDKAHILTKTTWFCPVKINGANVTAALLKAGDKVQIGNNHFTYTLREGM